MNGWRSLFLALVFGFDEGCGRDLVVFVSLNQTDALRGSAHGVRKIAATRAANNGATVAELEAMFGWTGGRMASYYTREADRRRLAKGAISKLTNNARTSIPAPRRPVRALEPKSK